LIEKLRNLNRQCEINNSTIHNFEKDKKKLLSDYQLTTESLTYKLQQNDYFLSQYEQQNQQLTIKLKQLEYEIENKPTVQQLHSNESPSTLIIIITTSINCIITSQLLYTT